MFSSNRHRRNGKGKVKLQPVTNAIGGKRPPLLKGVGNVVQGKVWLYTLAPGVLAESREVRLGICTLRFGGE